MHEMQAYTGRENKRQQAAIQLVLMPKVLYRTCEHALLCGRNRGCDCIPDQSVDLLRLNVIQAANSILNLFLVASDVHNKNLQGRKRQTIAASTSSLKVPLTLQRDYHSGLPIKKQL